jgi:adhesin transport system membrane fusion protein
MSKRKEIKDAFDRRERQGLLSAFSEEEDLHFMSEVDAAIHRKGSSIAFILTLVIALLMVTFVVWAHFTVLDEVTRGMGSVIPSQKVQMIQNLEGGILQEISVQENQIVNKGDILIRIDNELAASQYRDAFTKAAENEAARR